MSTRRTIVWFLILVVMVPGLASAARRGRLVGRVVDPAGTPIEGVSVTASSPDVAGFNEVRTTDKKGTFILDFDTVNVIYKYRFQKAGYQTFDAEQNWSLEGTERHDFVMHPGESLSGDGLTPTSSSQPAIVAYTAGANALAAKDYAVAEKKFKEAVEHDPALRPAWYGLSVAQLGQGRDQ